jgi:hypothetical protein
MKKTRGMMADVVNDVVNGFLNDTARSFYIKRKCVRDKESCGH